MQSAIELAIETLRSDPSLALPLLRAKRDQMAGQLADLERTIRELEGGRGQRAGVRAQESGVRRPKPEESMPRVAARAEAPARARPLRQTAKTRRPEVRPETPAAAEDAGDGRTTRATAEPRIRAAIAGRSTFTTRDLVEATGLSLGGIRGAMVRLIDAGEVSIDHAGNRSDPTIYRVRSQESGVRSQESGASAAPAEASRYETRPRGPRKSWDEATTINGRLIQASDGPPPKGVFKDE